jgi:glutamine synthetase
MILQASTAALHEAGIHTLLVQFTDVHGTAKGKLVPVAHLQDVLRTGAGFAGPSIWGTGLPRTGPRSEYYARGDATTLQPLPWMPGVARIVGDGFVDGTAFEACPRQVLRRALGRLHERGWSLVTGIEPEFFLLRNGPAGWQPADAQDGLDKPSYDLKSLSRQQGFLHELAQALLACGLDVQQIDHEDAHGQYELNYAHGPALLSADRLMLLKLAAHALADRRDRVCSWMPKPFADQPGSGMHVHVSLWEGSRNLFAHDPGHEPAGEAADLSTLAGHFVAGVLAHAGALCALAAPTVNSYKRLGAGGSRSGTTWSPTHVAHGPNNRTALVRTLPGRFEWRLPDASANPYLITAALVAAGLDGIDRRLDPGPACHDDLYAAGTSAGGGPEGGAGLPRSLDEAVQALRRDEVILGALGPQLAAELLHLKSQEWQAWSQHVGAWELERYARAF